MGFRCGPMWFRNQTHPRPSPPLKGRELEQCKSSLFDREGVTGPVASGCGFFHYNTHGHAHSRASRQRVDRHHAFHA
jgi:hypothetical protein